jgi:hypothetical protein
MRFEMLFKMCPDDRNRLSVVRSVGPICLQLHMFRQYSTVREDRLEESRTSREKNFDSREQSIVLALRRMSDERLPIH